MKDNWLKERVYDKPLILDREMIRSKAYLDLKPSSIRVLLEAHSRVQVAAIKVGRRKRYIISNNGKIHLSYESLKKTCGLSTQTISSSFKDLITHGFLEVAHQGSGQQQDCSLYAITNNWKTWVKDVKNKT